MRAHPPRVAALAWAVVAACASCSETTEGTPVAAPPGPPPPPVPVAYGAPPVTSPLNASAYLTQPCSILTGEQLTSLGFPPQGKPDTHSGPADIAGPACTWQNEQRTTQAAFITANKNGLSDIYRGHQQGDFQFWQPTTIAGYPAVFNDPTDLRSVGACGLNVGISDTLTILVAVEGSDTDPCAPARQAAAMVIDTLKAG